MNSNLEVVTALTSTPPRTLNRRCRHGGAFGNSFKQMLTSGGMFTCEPSDKATDYIDKNSHA